MKVFDKNGREIVRGDIVKVFHFMDGRRKRHYMYKQCLGAMASRSGKHEYVYFSHLNFIEMGERDGPYPEGVGLLKDYEIVQSIKCDHEDRPRTVAVTVTEIE